MKTKLIVLTVTIWVIFPIVVGIVYSLFEREDLDIALMNNVIRVGILIFALLSALTLYLCTKFLLKTSKKNTDKAVSIVCMLATLAAVVLFTPAMLNNFIV